jgi:hypothetical protein
MTTRLINSLWILILFLMLLGCDRQESSPIIIETSDSQGATQPTGSGIATDQITATATGSMQESTYHDPDPDPPLALVSLKGHTVRFECLNRNDCIPEINLEGHVHFESPYHLGQVYYWNPESIYITLLSNSAIPEKMDIIHVNPQTGEIISILSPDEAEFSLVKIANGRLILARLQGQVIYVVEDDLSITEVKVGTDIYKLIVDGDKVIALNQIPIEMDGLIYVDVSVVDAASKAVKSERLKLPGLEMAHGSSTPEANKKYLLYIEGVSGDLKNLYCVFTSGDEPDIVKLGTFDVEIPKETAAIQGGVTAADYAQYHGMLYTEYSEKSDGGPGASLYEMATGRSIINYDKNPDWIGKKLLVVPFGDYILIGRSDEIILLSPTGVLINRYALPEKWVNKDYQIVHFEK